MNAKKIAAVAGLFAVAIFAGCEGDINRPTNQPEVKVQGTPDLDPATDHDVDVKPPDVDVEVHPRPGLDDVDVDVAKPADHDTKANESEPPGRD